MPASRQRKSWAPLQANAEGSKMGRFVGHCKLQLGGMTMMGIFLGLLSFPTSAGVILSDAMFGLQTILQ